MQPVTCKRMENYFADPLRYDGGMKYERCGRSGVMLPKVSLGFWHNFGGIDSYERAREITHYAFDHGVVLSTWPTTTAHLMGRQRKRWAD